MPKTADDFMETSSVVIVALPHGDDRTHDIGPETKHATILFLGPADAVTPDQHAEILEAMRSLIEAKPELAASTVEVTGIGELGDEGARVWHLGDGAATLETLREMLLDNETIRALFDSVDQYPQFTPHVTIGYYDDDEPLPPEADTIESIQFDALALWSGDEEALVFPEAQPETAGLMSMTVTGEEFAASRDRLQEEVAASLLPGVTTAISSGDWDEVEMDVEAAFYSVYLTERGDTDDSPGFSLITEALAGLVENTTGDSKPETVAMALAVMAINAGTLAAAGADDGIDVEWVSMPDDSVRDTHRLASGQRRAVGERFTVGAANPLYPGEPVGPIEDWINCRCHLRPVAAASSVAASAATEVWQSGSSTELSQGDTMPDDNEIEIEPREDEEVADDIEDDDDVVVASLVPWHGVLTVEGVPSGDGRKFALGALRQRPLDDAHLPLTYQRESADGHSKAFTVGMIEGMARDPEGKIWGWGHMRATEYGDEVVGLLADFKRFGVSIDADDSQFEFDDEAEEVTFTSARVCSACIVPIPAFAEAYVALGEMPEMDGLEPLLAGRKDAVPLAEDEALVASVEFKRGPGWLTHPKETKRLHDYWTRPGQPGFVKIGWGTPGDFNRCRVLVGEKIAKNSPEDVRYMNQICAEWHHDALGIWPGEHSSARTAEAPGAGVARLSLVASGKDRTVPFEHFTNPELDGPTPLTIDPDGRVYGHLAAWGVCHIGIGNACVVAPSSMTDYAYFAMGQVNTDQGPVRVGQLTIGGGHADEEYGVRPAIDHYDRTSTAWADVAVGEDAHGIWYSGHVREFVDRDLVFSAQASGQLSGDWRMVAGNLELVAALSVNTPGFGVPRARATVVAGAQQSLVAAGMIEPRQMDGPVNIDYDALATKVADKIAARQERLDRVKELIERAGRDH